MEIDHEIYVKSSESDISTYEEIEKLQEQNNLQYKLMHSLQADIDKVCAKIVNMNQTQTQLNHSISELYKIAKAETEKKNKLITDLRFELEKVKSERRIHSTKREISPCLQRSTSDSANKKLKRKQENDTDQNGSHRSHSRDKYRKSYNHENKERRRKEIGTHYHEKKSIRDHNHRKKSPICDGKKSEKLRKADSKTEKCDINTERNSKRPSIVENKGVNIVNEECNQESSIKNKPVFDISVINRKSGTEESINKKEIEVTQSAVLENSQVSITQLEKKNVQEHKELSEHSSINNGNVQIRIKKNLEINKNGEKTEDVPVKLKQNLSSSALMEENDISETVAENTSFNTGKVILYEENNHVCDVKDDKNTMKRKNDVKCNEVMDENEKKDNHLRDSHATKKALDINMSGEDKKIEKIFTTLKSSEKERNVSDVEKLNTGGHDGLEGTQNAEISKTNIKNAASEKTSEESPPSGRILRSAARRNNCKESKTSNKMFLQNTSSNQLFLSDCEDKICLTHEGEIPVLHISDGENSPYDKFDLSFSSVTSETKPLETTKLKEDLDISINQNHSENKINDSRCSFMEKSLITSSTKKKRRYLVTLIDP